MDTSTSYLFTERALEKAPPVEAGRVDVKRQFLVVLPCLNEHFAPLTSIPLSHSTIEYFWQGLLMTMQRKDGIDSEPLRILKCLLEA